MRQTLAAATAFLALALAASSPSPVAAQNSPFSPRIMVNDKAITYYEYDQRARFMRLLNAPGDVAKEAERTLIEDRLRLDAAGRMKIRITPAEITAGMTEFAARFELGVEEFVKILEANGVVAETFRDFVHAGMAWREVVKARFGPGALAGIYEPQVDRALSAEGTSQITRVLLSEIQLRTDDRNLARELSRTLKGEAAFAAAARKHSLAETAAQGGRTDWRDAAAMPQPVLAAIDGLQSGQVSAPVRLPEGRYGLYLVRDVQLGAARTPANTAVDYARVNLGPAGSESAAALAQQIRSGADSCMDLNKFSGQVVRQTTVQGQLPGEVASRLAALDQNEAVVYTSGGAQVLLMLCSRRVQSASEPDRDTIRGRLAEGQVSGKAELFLQELRTNAHIRRP